MAKISTYNNADPVTLSDKVIGTSVNDTPENSTKNFLIADIIALAAGGAELWTTNMNGLNPTDITNDIGIGMVLPLYPLDLLSTGVNSARFDSSQPSNYISIHTSTTGNNVTTDGLLIGVDTSSEARVLNKESASLLLGTSNTTRVDIGATGITKLSSYITPVFHTAATGSYAAWDATGTFIQKTAAEMQSELGIAGGDMILAAAQTNSGIKTFLDTTMKLRNVANTFDGYFVNTNTADRIYTLQDAAGTLAFLSDITDSIYTGSGTVPTTVTATITDTLNFTGGIGVGFGVVPTARVHVKGSGATSATFAAKFENSAATSLMVVRDDGNVGIGIDTPIAQLDIRGTQALMLNINKANGVLVPSVSTDFAIQDGGSNAQMELLGTGFNRISFSDNTSNRGSITYQHSTDYLEFAAGGSNRRLAITNLGKIILDNYTVGNQISNITDNVLFTNDAGIIQKETLPNLAAALGASGGGLWSTNANGIHATDITDFVGVGINLPVTKLQISDTNKTASHIIGTTNVVVNTTNVQGVDIGASIGLGGYIDDAQSTLRNFGVISGRKTNSTSGNARGYLSLATLQNGSLVETMRLDDNGNVGIGTSSPTTLLNIKGVNTGTTKSFLLEDSAGTDRLFVQNDGKVSIGIATPLFPLHVNGGARLTNLTGNSVFSLENNTGLWSLYSLNSTSNFVISPSVDGFVFFRNQALTTVMSVDTANERVGIGTETPTAKLEIAGTTLINNQSASATLQVQNNTNIWSLYGLNSSNNFIVKPSTNDGNFIFRDQAGLDFLTIDAAATELKVEGAAFGNPKIRIFETGDTEYTLEASVTNFSIKHDGTKAIDILDNGNIYFYDSTGASLDLRWDASTSFLAVGNTTPNSRLEVFGSVSKRLVTVITTSYSLDDEHTIIADDDTAGSTVTLTLPAASGIDGRIYVIKKIGTTANVVIDGNAAETIDGALTATLTTQYESITIQCDGTSWWII